jgi:uncharacterized membrane protein
MRIILSILYAPFILLILHYNNIKLDDLLALKAFPLIMSIIMTFLIYLSYKKENSIILKFAQRFSKVKISLLEQQYIQQSTLYWVGVSCVNVIIHLSLFLLDEIAIWVIYSSIGWYAIFIVGGVLQFFHRKFIFLKKVNNES